jgi:hypothetical protein
MWNVYIDNDGNLYPHCPWCTEDVERDYEFCPGCGYRPDSLTDDETKRMLKERYQSGERQTWRAW